MVYLILSSIFGIALAAFGIYFLYQFITNFKPSNKKVITDLKDMKKEVQAWTQTLVNWNREELELLSFAQIHKTIKKGLSKSAKGVFTTVYHEPLLAYNYKQYISSGVNALLYAKTSLHEFAYRITKKEVIISMNDEYLGVLKKDGGFYSGPKKDKLVAKINQEDELKLRPIIIGDKEVASVVNASKTTLPNARAFKFVAPMKEEDENIFLSLAILEIVTESLDK